MTTRRERKIIEAEARTEAEAASRKKTQKTIAISVVGSLFFFGAMVTVWKHLPTFGSGRKVASTDSKADAKIDPKNPEGKKSIDDIQKDLKSQLDKFQQSKEWKLVNEGHTDEIIEAFKKLSLKGSAPREERVRLLNTLSRGIKPRKEWASGFNDQKMFAVLDFLAEIPKTPEFHGAEEVASIDTMGSYAKAVPEAKFKVEKAFLELYARDERPGPRGAIIGTFGEMKSVKGFPLIAKAAHSTETATARIALYALKEYEGTTLQKQAHDAIRWVAQNDANNRPLAAKLLAFVGDARAAEFVPTLLRKDASPPELESGAYIVERLKLTKFKQSLGTAEQSGDPAVHDQAASALKALDK